MLVESIIRHTTCLILIPIVANHRDELNQHRTHSRHSIGVRRTYKHRRHLHRHRLRTPLVSLHLSYRPPRPHSSSCHNISHRYHPPTILPTHPYECVHGNHTTYHRMEPTQLHQLTQAQQRRYHLQLSVAPIHSHPIRCHNDPPPCRPCNHPLRPFTHL